MTSTLYSYLIFKKGTAASAIANHAAKRGRTPVDCDGIYKQEGLKQMQP